jgi:hypothetical protein
MMFELFTPTLAGSRLNLPLGNSSHPPGTSPALYGTRTGSRHDPKTLAVEPAGEVDGDGDTGFGDDTRVEEACVGLALAVEVAEPHAVPSTARRTRMPAVTRTGTIVST